MLLAFGTCVSGDCFHVCLPKIKESENEYPHQVDEVPVQAGDLHRLIAPLTVIESAPNPQSYDSQVDNARRYVQAVEPGDHKETRSKLCRAQWVSPGTNSFPDELGPLERLHANERGPERRSDQHQRRGIGAMAAVAEVDGHRHGPAAGDQNHGHDRDQDQRDVRAADIEGEDLARIRPGHGGGYSYIHVRSEETGEDEGIAEQEDPHHRLAPGDRERLLVPRPVGDDSRQACGRGGGFSSSCRGMFCHTNLIRGFRWTAAQRTGPATPAAGNASTRYTAPRSGPHPAARRPGAPF